MSQNKWNPEQQLFPPFSIMGNDFFPENGKLKPKDNPIPEGNKSATKLQTPRGILASENGKDEFNREVQHVTSTIATGNNRGKRKRKSVLKAKTS